MPFQSIPGIDVQYGLISFDKDGKERTDDPSGGVFSTKLLQTIDDQKPTDIFLFSHGWKGDFPSAVEQYDKWIGAMWKLQADRTAMGQSFKPFFIGLHWPSQPWGEEKFAASFGVGEAGTDPVLEAAVEHFGGGSEVRKPLEVIVGAYREDPTATVVPDHVVAAYQDLAKAIGFDAGNGPEAPPDQDGAPLNPQAAVAAEAVADAATGGNAVSFGVFDSVKNGILAGLRQTSFWLMKHRARTIGEEGMHQFVAELQRRSTASIHLMGHSFGCIVVSSILGGPKGNGALPQPISSAVLVQGALSLWSYADTIPESDKPGYFRNLLKAGAVSGPIVTTQSSNDSAVGVAFPAAVGVVGEVDFGVQLPKFGGVGTWGIQGTTIAESLKMLDAQGRYGFQKAKIYNVDGSQFIPGHSDIDGPEVAHLQWQVVKIS
jgi:hypothetical protein